MSSLHVAFFAPINIGGTSIYAREPRAAETLAVSGTSAATTITAMQGEVASVTAQGGAIFVRIGSAPTAASGTGYLIPDGSTREIGFLNTSDKVAGIDA